VVFPVAIINYNSTLKNLTVAHISHPFIKPRNSLNFSHQPACYQTLFQARFIQSKNSHSTYLISILV